MEKNRVPIVTRHFYRQRKKIKKFTFRQYKLTNLLRAKKKMAHRVKMSKLLAVKDGKILGKKVRRGFVTQNITSAIFNQVMLYILNDMIDNKNTLRLPRYGVDMFVAMNISPKEKKAFFALDSSHTKNPVVKNAEKRGYAWRVHVGNELKDKLDDKIYINKEIYPQCKRLTGKQWLGSYSVKCRP